MAEQEISLPSVNFREAQKKNARRTFILIFLFLILFSAVGGVFGAALAGPKLWYWGLIIAFGLAIIWVFFGWFLGGPMTLAVSHAKRIDEPKTPAERQFFNVVEEISLAAGLPMPKVYVIHDTAMNAFACGRNEKVACITATSGLLEKLTREELQGVVGHEMGHIRNHDIMYTVLLIMLVGVLVLLCDMFLRIVFYSGGGRRSSSGKGGGSGQAIFLIIGIVLAIIAPILARMIFFAVSREREYLADATAVELTRNSRGIASALKKLAGDKEVLEAANRATAHLYIVHPIKKFEKRAASIFSTHPPIKERIARLEAMS